jgi:hypothetical protein
MATYTITTDAFQEAILTALAAISPPPAVPLGNPIPSFQPIPNPDYLASLVKDHLLERARMSQPQVLATLLQKFFAADAPTQATVLTLLNLTDFATLAQPAQQKAFQALAAPAFLALSYEDQVKVCVALGF